MSVPTNVYTGIAKYPLLALPVFILAGMIFERAGVAERLVRFVSVLVGKRPGGPAIVACWSACSSAASRARARPTPPRSRW